MRGRRAEDLTGKRFGRWTVIKRDGSVNYNSCVQALWLCRCDCGEERLVRGNSLRNGTSKSCGCARCGWEDLTGERFGRLVVIGKGEPHVYVQRDKAGKFVRINKFRRWKCRCDCGKEVEVLAMNLKNGQTRTCGCRGKNL